MASSLDVIPRDKLKIWEIFRDVGPEGEKILKTAKLAHVFSREAAYVVTMADETYSFLRNSDDVSRVCKIAKIPQLCGVRVKEFAVGWIELAITEDGSLYSWILNDHDVFELEPDSTHFALLGRLERDNVDENTAESDVVLTPHRVLGSLTEKKVDQVALSSMRVMALTVSGDVYQWGQVFSSWTPRLVPKQHFHSQQVISVACTNDISVALTFNGELFQWERDNTVPQKVVVDDAPFKKITRSKNLVFALTVNGALYSARLEDSESTERKPIVWTDVFGDDKFQDIAGSGDDDVVVFELKNNTRFAFRYSEENLYPPLTSFSQSCTSIEELFAEKIQATYRTVSAQTHLKPRTVGIDIGNLGSKENSDVTFSLEGKTISGHKCILACRNEYFAKMFNHEWKEAQGSLLEVKDTKYGTFEALLFYIYNDKIKFEEDDYENIFDLMMLADSYCDFKIRQDCEKILIRNITTENAVFLVRNASLANALDLERTVVKFILDKRLLDLNSSPEELIELVGMHAFKKISMGALHRV